MCNKNTKAISHDSSNATDLLKESVDRLNINGQNADFRKNATNVIAAMLEARITKKQQQQHQQLEQKIIDDPEFLPPPPPSILSRQQSINNQHSDQDLPLPPPPPHSPLKIPSSILTPPLSSDENDLPSSQKPIVDTVNCGIGNFGAEKVNYRHKKHHQMNNPSSQSDNNNNCNNNNNNNSNNNRSIRCNNKPELSTHARDRRSYIERNNNSNEICLNGTAGDIDKEMLDAIAKDIANGQHPVCDKCKCKITR